MTHTFNFKIVCFSLGALLVIEALFMFLSCFVSLIYAETEGLGILTAALITLGVGLLGLGLGRNAHKRLGKREGYIIVASVWLVFSLFGLLPYLITGTISSFTNAFFETISGFTTTGASIFTDVESLPHGILFWRALTHWLGGMGIIVLSLAIFPFLGIGGMSLFSAEATGTTYEKLRPHMRDTAKLLWGIYCALTLLETFLLGLLGMDWFDAICHSFSTMSTGGFSTKNVGMGAFSPAIQYVVIFFMFCAGVNFSLLYFLMKRKVMRLKQDEELRWYATAVGFFTLIITTGLIWHGGDNTWTMWEKSFREALFVVVNIMTTTGFSGVDYTQWPSFLLLITFFIYFTGASAGSTAGGIKWSRIAFLCKNVFCEFKRLIHPNAIIPVRMNGKVINSNVANAISAFVIVYLLLVFVGTLIISMCGLPMEEALGAAAASVGNVGPGLGASGPAGTYAMMPNLVKWVMALLMLLGRLELFTVLLVFTPSFWRK